MSPPSQGGADPLTVSAPPAPPTEAWPQPAGFAALRRLNRGLQRSLRLVLTLLMGALIVPVTLQILSRYVGLIPRYIWTEEVARFCFIWIVMIGAVIAVRDGTHFDLDVLRPKTRRGAAALRLVVHTGIALVALIFVVYGWPFALFGLQQESELTGISMLSIYIAWPLAGLAMLLFLAEKFLDDLQLLRGGRP